MKNHWIWVASVVFAAFGCSIDRSHEAVKTAEAAYEAQPSKENADRLTAASADFVQKNADQKAECFRLAQKIAQLAWREKDFRLSVKWAADAVTRFGDGQNLTEPVELLGQIWSEKLYRNVRALEMEPKDEARLQTVLRNHAVWLDSALVRAQKAAEPDSAHLIDKAACSRFISLTEAVLSLQPSRPDASKMLMAAAEKALAAEQFGKANVFYRTVQERFPNSEEAKTALFLDAFSLENNMKDIERARERYQLFLKKYPKDDLAPSAAMSIKYLGKTDEELIAEFEKRLAER